MNKCTKFYFVRWFFICLIYSTPCIYITYRSSHYNWLIFIPLFQFHIRNTRTNFLLVSLCCFWFLLFWPPCIYYICIPVLSKGGCPLHWDLQYDGVLHWAKEGVVIRCTVIRCTHCDSLHSLWPVALTMTRCIISFCRSVAGSHLQKWRCLLCLTESLWVIHCFPCDKNLIHLSTLYMLYIHFCIIKGPVALGPAIWRCSSWSKGVARCTETRNMTAFLIEQRW